MGLFISQISLLTDADKIFLASPSLIDFAISKAFEPFGTSFILPSGKLIFIIINVNYLIANITTLKDVICNLLKIKEYIIDEKGDYGKTSAENIISLLKK